MRRREFIKLVGGAAAWPVAGSSARAQQPKIARLGWVTTGTAAAVNPFLAALRAGLADHGYIEGAISRSLRAMPMGISTASCPWRKNCAACQSI
jgi:hypothetical protein